MENVKFTLSHPISFNGDTFSELTFREPLLKDAIAGETAARDGGETARIAAVLASMAGVPYEAFQKIRARDFGKILDLTQDLLGNGSETDEAGIASPSS